MAEAKLVPHSTVVHNPMDLLAFCEFYSVAAAADGQYIGRLFVTSPGIRQICDTCCQA